MTKRVVLRNLSKDKHIPDRQYSVFLLIRYLFWIIAIVLIIDFADSAIVFEILFWSTNMFWIENIKSDIRFSIREKFREEGIVIPFPQRDVHMM